MESLDFQSNQMIDKPNVDNCMAAFKTITTNSTELYKLDNQTSLSTSTMTTMTPTTMAQWVYIQNPQKITSSSITKTTSSNIVINSSLQLSNLTNKSLPIHTNSGVILTPVNNSQIKQQHVIIQKPTGGGSVQNLPVLSVPPSKNTLTYFTMLKANQPNQKYVLAPMPKLTSNRLPSTVTTSCVQSKIALMPYPQPNSTCKPISSKHKVYNLKIADGQLQSESNGAITVMCDNNNSTDENNEKQDDSSNKLACNETVELNNDNKSIEQILEDKTYELSIVDNNYTCTFENDTDRSKGQHPSPNCNNITNNNCNIKDAQRFPKHGISILKRSFNLETKLEKSLIISPIPPSKIITTISDLNTKKVKISPKTNLESHPVINTEPPKIIQQKPERRRKSHFFCRKDYDEVIITPENSSEKKKVNEPPVVTVTKSNQTPTEEVMEITMIKEESDINMNEAFDVKKVLHWEGGIGTLPGSEIKFHVNEFGILEYLKQEEYMKLLELKLKPKETVKKAEFQDDICCLECGCYGMPTDFINLKYCSYDCQEAGVKAAKLREAKLKRKTTKAFIKKPSGTDLNASDTKSEKEDFPSEEDQSTSNENSQDKFMNYPWTCTKKGFSWAKYLEHMKAKAVPVKYFKDPFPYNRNGFRPGMKLEGVDPMHASNFSVLTVAEVIGYRLRLHFDGYPEYYDFWVNADSMDIFPAGWCEKYGHVLQPPPGYTTGSFNWNNYLKHTKSSVAPKHLFANRAGSVICPNGFRIGMKLEAVDRKNTSLICVATVSDMMDNRILIHFDGCNDIYDYWVDPTSPYIHPVSWCDQNGLKVSPPNGYPNPETFTWEKYLKETRAVGVPVRAFKQKSVYGFKKGMRLECVDKRVQQLIRAATVDDVREHQIRIKFDGWPDRYSFWTDNDSPNIHPVGWCQKTGHPIEPPLTPDDVYDFLECPTVGCKGLGHIQGPPFAIHSSTKDCPYADENMDIDKTVPDRLLSPNSELETVVLISKELKDKPKSRIGRPPKLVKHYSPIKIEWNDDDIEMEDCKTLKRKLPKCLSTFDDNCNDKVMKKEVLPLTNGYNNKFMEQIWEKHSRYLGDDFRPNMNPYEWQEEEVLKFVTSLPYCRNYGSAFKQHKIDGEALLMLSQQDLVNLLNIKLGPAIKLYSIIMLLRRSIVCIDPCE